MNWHSFDVLVTESENSIDNIASPVCWELKQLLIFSNSLVYMCCSITLQYNTFPTHATRKHQKFCFWSCRVNWQAGPKSPCVTACPLCFGDAESQFRAGGQAVSSLGTSFLRWHAQQLLLMPPRLGASLQQVADYPQLIL